MPITFIKNPWTYPSYASYLVANKTLKAVRAVSGFVQRWELRFETNVGLKLVKRLGLVGKTFSVTGGHPRDVPNYFRCDAVINPLKPHTPSVMLGVDAHSRRRLEVHYSDRGIIVSEIITERYNEECMKPFDGPHLGNPLDRSPIVISDATLDKSRGIADFLEEQRDSKNAKPKKKGV
jgi:hypothetical protein